MNVEEIRKYCLAFPEATENLQWGDDLCFKIRGKIFVTLALTAVPQKLCFKCAAETFAELLERKDIHPAPYVGRYKWVILDRLDALGTDELRDFIRRSYEMVAAKAPGKSRSRRNGSKKKAPKKKSATPYDRRKRC
jgi:predicted DNA-binding protein (MmcQ/YjbR family)